MRIDVVPEHPWEVELVKALNMDWLLYGEMHITNAPNGNGLTRLDPRGITYTPLQESERQAAEPEGT